MKGFFVALFVVAVSCTTVTLKVMTFNIFYGGTSLNLTDGSWCQPKPHGCPSNLEVIAEAIRYSQADVVGLEETEGNTQVKKTTGKKKKTKKGEKFSNSG